GKKKFPCPFHKKEWLPVVMFELSFEFGSLHPARVEFFSAGAGKRHAGRWILASIFRSYAVTGGFLFEELLLPPLSLIENFESHDERRKDPEITRNFLGIEARAEHVAHDESEQSAEKSERGRFRKRVLRRLVNNEGLPHHAGNHPEKDKERREPHFRGN